MKVLIAEDDLNVTQFLERFLERAYREDGVVETRVANTVAGARSLLPEGGWDFALLDVNMPDGSGLEVLDELRRNTSTWDVPVIVLTGDSRRESILQAFDRGASDFVGKPFEPVQLRTRIDVLLQVRRRDRELRESLEFTRGLIQGSVDMIIAVDASRNITEFNAAAEKCFGYARSEVLGRTISMLYGNRQTVDKVAQALAESGHYQGEVLNRRKDGREFVAYLSAAVLKKPDGGELGFIGVSRDVTEQHEAEQMRFRQLMALSELARDPRLHEGSLDHAFGAITEWASVTLNADHVFIWLRDLDETRFRCMDHYHSRNHSHDSGELRSAELLFKSSDTQFIEATRPGLQDPAVSTSFMDMSAGAPSANLYSVMDAPIVQDGKTIGVIRVKRSGMTRDWPLSEQSFARSLANLVPLALRNYEQRQAEHALRDSQSRLSAILSASRDALFVQQDRVVIFANDALAQLLGYPSSNEIVGKEAMLLAVPGQREMLADRAARRIAGEEVPSIYEFEAAHASGRPVEVEASVSSFSIAGKPQILVLMRDITERKRMERLQESRQAELRRMNDALTSLAQQIAVYEGDFEFACRLFTEEATAAIRVQRAVVWRIDEGRTSLCCIDLFDASSGRHSRGQERKVPLHPGYFQAIMAHQFLDAENALTDPRLSELVEGWFKPAGISSVLDVPMRWRGRVVGVVSFEHVGPTRQWTQEERGFACSLDRLLELALEAGDRRRAEIALRQSEEELRSNFMLAPMAIALMTPEGVFQQANPAFLKLAGLDGQHLVGSLALQLVHPGEQHAFQKAIQRLASGEASDVTLDFRYLRPDGCAIEVSMVAGAVLDASRKPLRLIAMHTDLSERKRMEDELLQARKLKALGEISGGVAHEFNNLLSPMLIQTAVISKIYSHDPILCEQLQPIREAVQQAAELCQRILSLGKKASDRREFLSLHESVEAVARLLSQTIDRRIHIELELDRSAPRLWLVRTHIAQIVMNLGFNARDAMIELVESEARKNEHWKPQLTIGTGCVTARKPQAGGNARKFQCIRVSDNGPGMPPQVAQRIFEPFFTTKSAAKGTGLGLAMVWTLVDSLGGWIDLNTAPGEGTTFTVHLPEEESAHDDPASGMKAVEPRAQSARRVLLVEDDRLVAKTLCGLLRSSGHEVVHAQDGVAGWETLRANPDCFDVVISDINMPRMTGTQLAALIAGLPFKGRLVLTSGYLTDEQIKGLRDLGVHEVLRKPVPAEDIFRSLG